MVRIVVILFLLFQAFVWGKVVLRRWGPPSAAMVVVQPRAEVFARVLGNPELEGFRKVADTGSEQVYERTLDDWDVARLGGGPGWAGKIHMQLRVQSPGRITLAVTPAGVAGGPFEFDYYFENGTTGTTEVTVEADPDIPTPGLDGHERKKALEHVAYTMLHKSLDS